MANCKNCGFEGSPAEAHFYTRCFKLLSGPVVTGGHAASAIAAPAALPAKGSRVLPWGKLLILAAIVVALAVSAIQLLGGKHELQ